MLAGTASIALAAAPWGLWAIVAQLLLVSGLGSAGYWVAAGWQPRLQLDFAASRELFRFTRNLSVLIGRRRPADTLSA